MVLFDLWKCAAQSHIFIRHKSGTVEEYIGTKSEAGARIKSVKATSYPMFKSVIEVELE